MLGASPLVDKEATSLAQARERDAGRKGTGRTPRAPKNARFHGIDQFFRGLGRLPDVDPSISVIE